MTASDRAGEPPQNPAGEFEPRTDFVVHDRKALIAEIESLPARLRAAAEGLGEAQLDTKYRNWTIRQIVNHIADSHANGYIRTKLALTEDRPTIKPYDEGRWSLLDDAARGSIEPSLLLLAGLHDRWVRLLRAMTTKEFAREYFHPEAGRHVQLVEQLANYAWHGRHHTAQIVWLRERYGW